MERFDETVTRFVWEALKINAAFVAERNKTKKMMWRAQLVQTVLI